VSKSSPSTPSTRDQLWEEKRRRFEERRRRELDMGV
jgi:hypothetical protein